MNMNEIKNMMSNIFSQTYFHTFEKFRVIGFYNHCSILGRGGSKIQEMQDKSGTRIKVINISKL